MDEQDIDPKEDGGAEMPEDIEKMMAEDDFGAEGDDAEESFSY